MKARFIVVMRDIGDVLIAGNYQSLARANAKRLRLIKGGVRAWVFRRPVEPFNYSDRGVRKRLARTVWKLPRDY